MHCPTRFKVSATRRRGAVFARRVAVVNSRKFSRNDLHGTLACFMSPVKYPAWGGNGVQKKRGDCRLLLWSFAGQSRGGHHWRALHCFAFNLSSLSSSFRVILGMSTAKKLPAMKNISPNPGRNHDCPFRPDSSRHSSGLLGM